MLTILNYNEHKVKEGAAKCIHENLFGCPVDKLNFYDKLHGLESFTNRNMRATSKAVHISLNFHPEEKLNESKLAEIASEYMDRIGFRDQPYLVYQHFDAGHPHIHIVTTNIQKDGSRILLFRRGKYESERARLAIEKKYNLIEAAGRKQKVAAHHAQRVIYGKSEIKRNISNVVRAVVDEYKFTSLPEFNAVLGQFNVVADRGREQSTMFTKKGLHYRILDKNGKKIGVPIKASTIHGKPTFTYLEKRFDLNNRLRPPLKDRLVKCIDDSFNGKASISRSNFVQALSRENINVLFRQNEEGRIYGLTFIDNKNKVVFNGSDLGKAYSAKALTERLTNLSGPAIISFPQTTSRAQTETSDNYKSEMSKMIDDLITSKQRDFTSPDSALKRRRKKRRRGRSM